jgi:hypothetical protein
MTPADTPSDAERTTAVDPRLARLRIVDIAAGCCLVGAASSGIFDSAEWSLIVAPALPAAAALALLMRSAVARVVGAVAAVVLAVTLAVLASSGSMADVARSFTSGVQGLLSTEWPSPTRPELVGTVAAAVAITGAMCSELAARRRFHLAALVPLLTAYVGVVALSAPLGAQWQWLIGLLVVSTVFALLRNDGTLGDRLLLLRGERRLLPLFAAAVILVGLASIPVSLDERADPRRNDPAEQTAPLLDPIEATLALRNIDPAVDLHVVTTDDDSSLPDRWRTAALSSYDGRRWSPSLTLRPIGSTLGPANGPTIEADVSFLDDNLTLVPMPGAPVAVGADVETDGDRTVVRLAERPSAGDLIALTANMPATSADATSVGLASRLVDESTSDLTQLAEGLAGDGDDLERLEQLETTMREEFVLDSDVQGGGLERALIDRFLRDTQRGTNEQFATSFALLARSLGIESRVATGFVSSDTATQPGEPLVLTSSDAAVWPEVQLADGRWVAFDPAPSEEASDGAPPPPEPQAQAPAAPQPPIEPPPDSDSEPASDDEAVDEDRDRTLSIALGWLLRGSLALAAILVPLAIVAGVILGVKYRRRSRRLRAPDPVERIRGAWASATDALVDAGLRIETSSTDSEIASDAAPLAPLASPATRRLAVMSSSATFGTPPHPDLLAHDAVACLESVEHAITSARTRWQRVRWRLSLRSLRAATRSPLSD